MNCYKEWRDFVIYTGNPEKGNSLAARFNIKKALPAGSGAEEGKGVTVVLSDVCRAVRQESGEMVDDSFELMKVGEQGEVHLWTKYRVWCVRREHRNGGMMERLIYLPRHPGAE